MIEAPVTASFLSCVARCAARGAGARAADDGPSAKIDCSQSGALMIDILESVETPVMTGDVDTDFAAIALAHEKRTAKLMKIEAACGKNGQVRAGASRAADNSAERVVQYQAQSCTNCVTKVSPSRPPGRRWKVPTIGSSSR